MNSWLNLVVPLVQDGIGLATDDVTCQLVGKTKRFKCSSCSWPMYEQSNVWQILFTTLRATKEIKLCLTMIKHVLKRNVKYRESESEYMLEREREIFQKN